MLTYITARILACVPVLVGVTLAVFSLLFLIPGDPVKMMLAEFATTPEQVARMRAQLHLDDPLPVQYGRFVGHALHGRPRDLDPEPPPGRPGDRGEPRQHRAVLATASMVVALVARRVAGAGRRAGAELVARRRLAMMVALLGVSMPSFWLGLLLILGFSLHLGWFPATGGGDLPHLVMPALTLGLIASAIIARLTRSSMLEVLGPRLRPHGAREGAGVAGASSCGTRLANALIPIITIFGLQFGNLLAGTVIVETVFGRPGARPAPGRAGSSTRTSPWSRGPILFVATAYVLINLLVDLTYAVVDPRIRFRSQPGSLRRHRRGRGSASSILGFLVLLAPWRGAVAQPEATRSGRRPGTPSSRRAPRFLLGSDQYGRDVAEPGAPRRAHLPRRSASSRCRSRWGSGRPIGLVSGYYGGRLDRPADARWWTSCLPFPGILLALAIVSVLRPSLANLMIAVGTRRRCRPTRDSSAPACSPPRSTSTWKPRRALGCRDRGILVRYLLPNVVAPLVVTATLGLGTAILSAAALSASWGWGASRPQPEWGRMLSEGRDYLREAWWIATFPGLGIMADRARR